MFKLFAAASGTLLTIAAIYKVQDEVGKKLQNEGLKAHSSTARIAAGFATSVVVGGIANQIIKTVFDNK